MTTRAEEALDYDQLMESYTSDPDQPIEQDGLSDSSFLDFEVYDEQEEQAPGNTTLSRLMKMPIVEENVTADYSPVDEIPSKPAMSRLLQGMQRPALYMDTSMQEELYQVHEEHTSPRSQMFSPLPKMNSHLQTELQQAYGEQAEPRQKMFQAGPQIDTKLKEELRQAQKLRPQQYEVPKYAPPTANPAVKIPVRKAVKKPAPIGMAFVHAQELLPSLPVLQFNTSKGARVALQTNLEKQLHAQAAFKGISVPSSLLKAPAHILMLHPKSSFDCESPLTAPGISPNLHLPPPPSHGPSLDELRQITQQIPRRRPEHSIRGTMQFANRSAPHEEHLSIEESNRQQRLGSLGIFELDPKARKRIGTAQIKHLPLSSFETPHHEQYEKLSKIKEIGEPTFLSSSAKVPTVPLTEIWKDLIASGKLSQSDFDEDKAAEYFAALRMNEH